MRVALLALLEGVEGGHYHSVMFVFFGELGGFDIAW